MEVDLEQGREVDLGIRISAKELKELNQWKAEDPEKQVGRSSKSKSSSSSSSSNLEMPNLISTKERKAEKQSEKSEIEKIQQDLMIQKALVDTLKGQYHELRTELSKLQSRLQNVERENQELKKREKEVLPVKKQRSRSLNPGFTYKPKVEKPTASFTSVTTKPTEEKKGLLSPPPPPAKAPTDEKTLFDKEEKKHLAAENERPSSPPPTVEREVSLRDEYVSFSHSRTILIRGLKFSTRDLSSNWLQRVFADTGVIDPSMEIREIRPIISTRSPAFLKVIFNREEDVKKVLNSKRHLQNYPSFRHVFINESKPKHEREREREERRRHRDEHFEHFSPRDIRHPTNPFYSHHHPPRRRHPPRYHRWWMGPPTESHWEY